VGSGWDLVAARPTIPDAGLRFDAVAGSSVGGLTAALLAAGRLQFGDEYWDAIAHGKVYRLRWRGLALLPVLLGLAR
jgi:predicted acylesterase/phospholipase RssA